MMDGRNKIAILCAAKKSVYKSIPDLDVYDQERDAYTFTGSSPVITHAPCAQWSRLRWRAKEDKREKELAHFCMEHVKKNGGVFEHPQGSVFFKTAGIRRHELVLVNQFRFGFQCRKSTLLYFSHCRPIYLTNPDHFQLEIQQFPTKGVADLDSRGKRSETTLQFAQWLIQCVTPILTERREFDEWDGWR